MIEYSIIAHPSQYEQVMTILYQHEIFPFEEDPADLQDYIDSFCEMCSEKTAFYILVFCPERKRTTFCES